MGESAVRSTSSQLTTGHVRQPAAGLAILGISAILGIFAIVAIPALAIAACLVSPASAATALAASTESEPLEVNVFYSSACPSCEDALRAAAEVRVSLGDAVRVRYWNVIVTENDALKRKFAAFYRLSDEDAAAIPLVFVGDRHLAGRDVTQARLLAAVEEAMKAGEKTPAGEYVSELGNPFSGDIERVSFPVVAAAGLADGVNPCAIATLVFFVSYLAACGWTKARIVWVGSLFTLGVFLAYLAAGFGLYQAILLLDLVPWARRAIRLAGAGMALVLAALSAADAVRTLRGGTDRMILRLPRALTLRAHGIVRRFAGRGFLPAAAFVTGVLVSGVEFICTGQVYLPTIIFMRSQAEHRATSVYYLLTYNIAFILPMVLVFLGVHLGLSSRRLASASRRSLVLAKAGIALVLFALGTYMLLDALGAGLPT